MALTVAAALFGGEFADRTAALSIAAETASEHTQEIRRVPGRIRFRGDGAGRLMQALCEEANPGSSCLLSAGALGS
jgi:hypothetical protein